MLKQIYEELEKKRNEVHNTLDGLIALRDTVKEKDIDDREPIMYNHVDAAIQCLSVAETRLDYAIEQLDV